MYETPFWTFAGTDKEKVLSVLRGFVAEKTGGIDSASAECSAIGLKRHCASEESGLSEWHVSYLDITPPPSPDPTQSGMPWSLEKGGE